MKARFWATVLSLLFGAVLAWYLVYTRQLVSAVNADAKALSLMYAQVLQGVNDPDRETFVVLFDMLEAVNSLYIYDRRWTFDPMFHIDQKIGAAGQNFGRRLVLQNGDSLLKIFWLEIFEFW